MSEDHIAELRHKFNYIALTPVVCNIWATTHLPLLLLPAHPKLHLTETTPGILRQGGAALKMSCLFPHVPLEFGFKLESMVRRGEEVAFKNSSSYPKPHVARKSVLRRGSWEDPGTLNSNHLLLMGKSDQGRIWGRIENIPKPQRD